MIKEMYFPGFCLSIVSFCRKMICSQFIVRVIREPDVFLPVYCLRTRSPTEESRIAFCHSRLEMGKGHQPGKPRREKKKFQLKAVEKNH